MNKEKEGRGTVGRVAGPELAYVVSNEPAGFVAFTPDAIAGYRGGDLAANNITVGSRVDFVYRTDSETIEKVTVTISGESHRADVISGENALGATPVPTPHRGTRRTELLPSTPPSGRCVVPRALPLETRAFGRLVDTASLQAGDLMLSREVGPDFISKEISNFQVAGGYSTTDSIWTHAAMYVGDGESIVEATFENPLTGKICLTSLDNYSKGTHSLRFRRPKWLASEREGWRACVRALRRLGEPYDFFGALKLWYQARIRGTELSATKRLKDCPVDLICSTLYADAYNEASGCRLGEVLGICVPAWLSVSDKFDDVNTCWLQIAD